MVLKDHVVNGSFIVCVKSSTGASSESVLKMLATFSHLMNYNDWCYQALVPISSVKYLRPAMARQSDNVEHF